jgi:hypothetical protein
MRGIKTKPEIVKFESSLNIFTNSNYFHTGKKFFTFPKQKVQRILPEISKYICIDTWHSKRTKNLQELLKNS